MKTTCQYHMCDGSGWRRPGWHLLRPCYCDAGRANRDAERAPEPPAAPRPMRIEEPAQKMRAQLDALKAVGR